jgi:hypothetical protein
MGRAAGSDMTAPSPRHGLVVAKLLALRPLELGLSTGWDAAARGEWAKLHAEAEAFNPRCFELSALSADELPSLLEWLRRAKPKASHLSFHGPSKGMQDADLDRVVALLEPMTAFGPVVMHPDTMGELAPYRRLASALLIENMDARKPVGARPADLDEIFAELPEARFCLDVSHVVSIDPTMQLGFDLVERHGARLAEVHVSSVDAGCHHVETTVADIGRYRPLLARCTAVPWILESAPAE